PRRGGSPSQPTGLTAFERQGQILLDRQVGCGAGHRVLEHPPEILRTPMLGHPGHLGAVDPDRPGVDGKSAGDRVEQGRLAGTVGSDDGDEIGFGELQRQILQSLAFVDRAGEEGLGDVVDLEHGPQPSFPAAAPAVPVGTSAISAGSCISVVPCGTAEAARFPRPRSEGIRLSTPHLGSSRATTTSSAVVSFMSLVSSPARRARKMIRRKRTEPSSAPRLAMTMLRLPSTAWPRMTEARPTRMSPMPMLMSEKPWYWATSAPQRATNPFDSARVSIVELSVLTPRLRIISLLLPVAWIASPRSVVRNQSMANLRMRAKASRIAIETQVPSHIFS